jgi:hypothetical protein
MFRAALISIIALVGSTLAMSQLTAKSPGAPVPPPKYKLSGPFTHGNLTLFYVHGPDTVPGKTVLTLKEAMEKKIVTVHETSNVNTLSIENTSTDVEVFVMSGDVVKGGKQDRVIAFDLVLPARSGTVPLPSFCVEHGRWTKRGAEASDYFGCPDTQVCSKELKAAINGSRMQGEVWKEVEAAQSKISGNIGKEVKNAASPSSLQLALEDKDLQAKVAAYENALAGQCRQASDIIGMAVVVNGEVSGADVFGSADLFRKLYPKLLKAAATEAFAELKKDKPVPACKAESVDAFLVEAAKAPAKEVVMVSNNNDQARQVLNVAPTQTQIGQARGDTGNSAKPTPAPKYRCRIVQYTAPKSLLVESHDNEQANVVWHRCYIAKDEPKPAPANQGQPQRGRGQTENAPAQKGGR